MHRIAVKANTGWMETGAASKPHSPVKTTSVITRGFVSARKSRQSAVIADDVVPIIGLLAIALSRWLAATIGTTNPCHQSIFGSVSNWWKGGGLDKVHSSVVALSPPVFASAFRPAISQHKRLSNKKQKSIVE